METDQTLIKRAKSGDEQAFQQLFDKYWQDLYKQAWLRVRSAEDAQDLVQEVFIAFWNNVHQVHIDTSAAAYLFTALRNRIFDFYEKQQVRLKYVLDQSFHPVHTPEQATRNIANKELQQVVNTAIQALPEKMRQIYQLSREQEHTIAEIASLLSLSPQTVKNQLSSALQRIRTEIQRYQLLLLL